MIRHSLPPRKPRQKKPFAAAARRRSRRLFLESLESRRLLAIELLSSPVPGAIGGNYAYYDPAVSADGRYVAFVSSAVDFGAGDTNAMRDRGGALPIPRIARCESHGTVLRRRTFPCVDRRLRRRHRGEGGSPLLKTKETFLRRRVLSLSPAADNRRVREAGASLCLTRGPDASAREHRVLLACASHRLHSEISKNWAGKPLTSYETVLKYKRTTKTDSGLRVKARLLPKRYVKGEKVSDREMARLRLTRHKTFPNWNYTLAPQ